MAYSLEKCCESLCHHLPAHGGVIVDQLRGEGEEEKGGVAMEKDLEGGGEGGGRVR